MGWKVKGGLHLKCTLLVHLMKRSHVSPHFNSIQKRKSCPKILHFLFSPLFWDSPSFAPGLFLLWVVLWMCLPSDFSGGGCDKLFVSMVCASSFQLNPVLCSYRIPGQSRRFWCQDWARAEQEWWDPVSGSAGSVPALPSLQRSWQGKCTQEGCMGVLGAAWQFEGPGLAQTSQLKAAQSENKSWSRLRTEQNLAVFGMYFYLTVEDMRASSSSFKMNPNNPFMLPSDFCIMNTWKIDVTVFCTFHSSVVPTELVCDTQTCHCNKWAYSSAVLCYFKYKKLDFYTIFHSLFYFAPALGCCL